jgi:amino acid transporter
MAMAAAQCDLLDVTTTDALSEKKKLGLAISKTTISYIVVFPAIIKLRYSHPHVPRPYRVPGGRAMPWVVGGLWTLWAIFASVVLIYPGFGTGSPDHALPAGFTRTQFDQSRHSRSKPARARSRCHLAARVR